MRPTLRSILTGLVPLAITTACVLGFAASAPAITLYDGSYSTDMSSSTPAGLSPASGVTIPYPTSNLRLSWYQVPGAEMYQLQVARQSNDDVECTDAGAFQIDNIVLTTTTTQNEWVPTLVDSAQGAEIWTGTYCWRVRTTGKGAGSWSEGSMFTRTWASRVTGLKFFNDHDGPIPRTSSDGDYETGSSKTRNAGYLDWTPLAGASKYEVQVSASQSFSQNSIMVSKDGITDTKVVLLHLPDDTYYWRVRGITPNGTEGGWSTGANAFTVKWQDPTWSSQGRLYPEDSSEQSEMRIGWTPMPGASHYEYQIGTNAGCFWDPTNTNGAPSLYGDWVNKTAVYNNTVDPPVFLYTQDPKWTQCRLSKLDATTINNWVTLPDMIDDEVWTNLNKDCFDEEAGTVLCELANFPDNVEDDRAEVPWLGTEMDAGQEDGEAYSIWWRVRPVYVLDQDSESGWEINGTLKIYGAWTKYRDGGANREHQFEFNEASAPYSTVGIRCDNPGINPWENECLEHVGQTLRADVEADAGDATTMQSPVFTWAPFDGAGGYILQIGRDPLFNNMERTVYVPATKSLGFGYQQSYAPLDGLVDNAEDTGYWWRVIPCSSFVDDVTTNSLTNCAGLYTEDGGGLPMSVDENGYDDMGVAQTFRKRTSIETSTVDRFSGATPLIRWAPEGTDDSDYEAWSAGVPGAHHYEVQVARDPFMTKDLIKMSTTIPRIAPVQPGAATGKSTELPDGIWYYRVRPVDRNGILGSWTNVESFNKRIEAPSIPVTGGGEGAGVVVKWTAVQGASSYDIEWSTDSGFESGISSATTNQSIFRIPDTTPGKFYWRVRATIDGVKGQWSTSTSPVSIVPATTLRYALNRNVTLAGYKVQVTGELRVAGAASNGKLVRLQRKTGGCDAATGSYVDSAQATTGNNVDDGLVNFPAKVVQNTCFRLAWVTDSAIKYSAPIAVKVAPISSVKLDRKLMKRGTKFCTTLRTNVAVNGRMRVQYRKGYGAWSTATTASLVRAKGKKVCVALAKAGVYKVRVVADNLKHSSGTWQQYETVVKSAGVVRVNDVWRRVKR